MSSLPSVFLSAGVAIRTASAIGCSLALLCCTPRQSLDSYTEGSGASSAGGTDMSSAGQAGAVGMAGAGGDSMTPSGDPDAGNVSLDSGLVADAALATAPDATDLVSAACDGATEFSGDGSCYLAIVETSTWQAARDACVTWGGQLVTIESEQEDDLVIAGANDAEYWIGYNDLETEGVYLWESGAPGEDAGGYTNWEDAPGLEQPTDVITQNCVGHVDTGGWYDLDCAEDADYGAVCERPL